MADCSPESPGNCKQGDLTSKHGMVPVGKKQSMFTKKFLLDSSLQLPDLGSSRSIYLTLFDTEHPDSFLACAQIRLLRPKTAKAIFGHDGIVGHVGFTHPSPFHPVQTDVALAGLHDGAGSFHIHEFPVPNRLEVSTHNLRQTCKSLQYILVTPRCIYSKQTPHDMLLEAELLNRNLSLTILAG